MTLENYFASHKPVMPATVARTTQDGLPTKELIDWEQLTLDFFDKTITSLDQRTDVVESTTGTNTAAIATEVTARTTADSALASTITTVEAKADAGTASGAVYLAAKSTPGGASASYGWFITAGAEFVGMEAGVDSVSGDGFIAFTADNFRLVDTGTAEKVFEWDGGDGVFRFFVPVEMLTEDIAQNAVTNAASDVQTVGGGANFDIVITTLANSPVVVMMVFSDPGLTTVQSGLSTFTGTSSTFDVKYDGVTLDSITAIHPVFARAGGGTFSTMMLPVAFVGRIAAGILTAGAHTIRVSNPTGGNLKMAGAVLETKR
jgi:hypothetical protein